MWNAPGAAIPIRVTVSFPAMIAVSSSRPLAPRASASAAAAGTTTVLTCETESECVSSKSSPWQSIAFANAAFGAGRRASRPITVASRLAAELRHRRAALAGDSQAVRREPAAERVEHVQLRVLDDLGGHRVEVELERELREALRCRRHHTLHSSSVPGKLRSACGAVRL